MDLDFYCCHLCLHTISGERVSDPGFVLLVHAHQDLHRAEDFERDARTLRTRAADAEERARAARAAVGILVGE